MDIEKSFASLLSLTLSGVEPDRAPASLISHLAQIVRQLPEGYRPDPENLAAWVETVHIQASAVPYADPPKKRESWKKLRESFEARWPVWDDDFPWGWHALSLAARQGDYVSVSRFLEMSQAPSPQELSTRKLPRFSKYPKGSEVHPAGGYTLLGALLQRAEYDAYPLVQKLLESGVDPNVSCAPGGVPPLLVATSPIHISLLQEKGASFLAAGQESMAWLDASKARRPQPIADLDTQLEAWRERLRGEKKGLFRQISIHLPELVDQAGEFIAGRPRGSDGASQIQIPAHLLQEIGGSVGVDTGNPGPTDPSLLGAFSRGQLRDGSVRAAMRTVRNGGPEAGRAFDLLPRHALNERYPWQGVAGGRPANVWGYLAHLAFGDRGRGEVIYPEAFVEQNSISREWWDHLKGAFQELESEIAARPHAPLRWRILGNMAPALSKHGQLEEWFPFFQEELEWVVGMQKSAAHHPVGEKLPHQYALLDESPGSRSWKDWIGMLESLARVLAREEPKDSLEMSHLILEAAALQGAIHEPTFAIIARKNQPDLDVPRMLRAKEDLARSGRISSPQNHEWSEFWMEMEIPSAALSQPKVRL